jgi:hypothetical protein
MITILVYLLDKHRFTHNLDSIVKFYYVMIDQDCVAFLVMFISDMCFTEYKLYHHSTHIVIMVV